MPLEKVEIRLDNDTIQYRPGQTVSGRVMLSAIDNDDTDIVSSEFNVTLNGEAKVAWNDIWRGRRHFSSELYVNSKRSLAEDGDIILKHGTKEASFKFSFQLPRNGPSSFTGEYGKVEYSLQVLLVRPWKFDWKTSMELQVTSIPINMSIQNPTKPSQGQTSKNFDFLWFSRGTLNLKVSTLKDRFLSGEMIRFEVEVNNESQKVVHDLTANICQVAEYIGKDIIVGKQRLAPIDSNSYLYPAYAQAPTADQEDLELGRTVYLAKVKYRNGTFNEIKRGKGVNAEAYDRWSGELQLPQVPPTTLAGATVLIGLQYFVNVTAFIEGSSTTIDAFCPFLVGSSS